MPWVDALEAAASVANFPRRLGQRRLEHWPTRSPIDITMRRFSSRGYSSNRLLLPANMDTEHNASPWLNIVLVHPEIPPNTGAVGRTCVALGAKLWLVQPLGFRTDEKTLRRAGLDYWKHLAWEVVPSLAELDERLGSARRWLFTTKGTQAPHDVAFAQGDVLMFGSESRGLPPSLFKRFPDSLLRIPTSGQVRSLNLSCSVAVAGFEAARQLRILG